MNEAGRLDDAVERAVRWSPFLAMLVDREPGIVAAARDGRLDLDAWIDPDLPTGTALRRARRALALSVALGDLAGVLDLTAVTAALTRFADLALDTAIRTAIAERYPGEEPRGFAAIALGKQGSHELNYSSDIDPILLFDPATLPRRAREEPEEAAVRIARRVVELLQARDGDGYVLRVDLRLRPSPEATPIALPVGGAIAYYESQALAWERAAFIRARAAAGDLALGQSFLGAIRPFVWRRTLDFGAVGEIRSLSARIRDHHAQGQRLGPGFDLKRGRGGIREVEFFAQIHQLIHGGRDAVLRAPATRDALTELAIAGWIEADDATDLAAAYTLLRTVEHRVQMIDDRQTHRLPTGDALDAVARLHGLANGEALIAMLRPHVERVGTVYDALDDRRRPALSVDAETLEQTLAARGFDAEAAGRRIAAWRGGSYPALRSPAAREALEAVLPVLVEALAKAPDPDQALLRLDRMLERMGSAINIFRLLEARPGLAELLARLLAHAPPLADELARRPALIDGLIDASALDTIDDAAPLVAAMLGGDAGDYGARLDHVRRVVGEARFALGAQIVAGSADPLAVAAGYARVADAAVEVLAQAAIAEFAAVHGQVPGSELVILALGRYGGGALTHASDLDLIYLFTGDFDAESDGAKPLGATLYYNRLASRVTAALSVATAAGALFEVDTRLRPSGAQGPLAVSLDSFARYARQDAWTWEHMALTRARPVFGSAAARGATQAIIDAVLGGDRPARDVVAEAVTMRADMARHKPPRGSLDVKLASGGLVDLEFAVHVLQLTGRTGFDPDLGRAIDALAAAGLVAPSLRAAHDLLTRLLVTLRLVAPDLEPPAPATRALIAAAVGVADWDSVVAGADAARQEVQAHWARLTEA
ncbi:bifunctional [glutamate--ammonia ligase]-adenylyl-L-tyrosine phosphorylase/[glutamate--ammonia-ligase] adenylyltransferase [Sphingomonas sp. KR1UV-12]|uniref:Bifunctional [glutamate--ammonia ligase]-adenylyl-L-tyrosine phosphorylase/[glutamate--ammonia-ligase] adenylyltransferase n=1 Tax=Sphingomonas aurea TaxID=3063994 RepID=A0ABT9EFA5_9SPHN|nr:bifunctional [glutamate--ammonia ligase]-adenylyl-L-tyrosine phosphorylase/[glutamate--ammonia-ligase] adenylyltransferase [Sphingomonas sp. KR1UV-12]MDP1025650.1 bifunctional [glutamate--ammonia ligase]-adenylyl-L-tyrosine phosphorylase/[glutamate--ammonia-ligase] adenylyltransferase [Sphingomonas sp. KR1UV-12]